MKITIITDNTVHEQGLLDEWGFSCLVETENNPRILFDTGTSGSVLLHNMDRLNIDPGSIDLVVISHNHFDHTGGLDDFLERNGKVRMYLPYALSHRPVGAEVTEVKGPVKICGNVYSTGKLKGIEQSLVVKLDKGLVVVVGCSHPGVGTILDSASELGSPMALIGGLHGFRRFDLVRDLDIVCPTHCTQHIDEIRRLYPGKFISGGAGRTIRI